MHLQTCQRSVQTIVHQIDQEIWNTVVDKAINKMPKYKLTKQSQKMLDDFTILTSQMKIKPPTPIFQQSQKTQTFKQTLIVGISKVIPCDKKQPSLLPKPNIQQPQKKDRKRLASAIQLNNDKKNENKTDLFRLTMGELSNEQQIKIQDHMRTTKYDNIRYNQQIQESQRQRRAQSQQRSLVQQKKFKEMKIFTYDYEGKLMPLGHENKSSKIHIVNMKPHFGNYTKPIKNSFQKLSKQQNILQIINKRIVNTRTPMDPTKEQQKEKEQRGSKMMKNLQPTQNVLEYLKVQNKVERGVTITDMSNKSKFIGKQRDPSQLSQTRFNQFKGQFKQLDNLRNKSLFTKLKLNQQPKTAIRTEYQESGNMRRLNTEHSDRNSKVFTSATNYSKWRGRINIKNKKLYTQNFVQDLN